MPPTDKAKAAGISASSFFDLKAELSKHEEDFSKRKLAGESRTIVGGIKRPDKKPTVWARQNKGVKSRAARDLVELEAVSKPTLDSARAALERKAKIYEKLRKGKSGGLNDTQYDALLVDFDSQGPSHYFQADSEDEDESLTVPTAHMEEDDDPIIEYEDEFGRLRTARRSEVPRELLPRNDTEGDIDEDEVIYNPVNHFPVYEHSADKMAEIIDAHSEANNPLGGHYDASNENRAKGAGFYQFSKDEETRRAQMDELKAAREETDRTRKEVGAVNVKPGEIEGMVDGPKDPTTVSSGKSRAMEKRKREIEERRKVIEAKRRKLHGEPPAEKLPASPPAQLASSMPTDPFSALESRVSISVSPSKPPPASAKSGGYDPFAALELQAKHGKRKNKASSSRKNDADAFLAQLEQEFKERKS